MPSLWCSFGIFCFGVVSPPGPPAPASFLNGVKLHTIWRLRVLTIKFLSVILAVASGLPCGSEGPMIHMGALVARNLSQN